MSTATDPAPARCSDWPAALARFIAEKSASRFDWERNNCAFFACDWVALCTGVDLAATYRDRVDSALSAARVLAEVGGIEAILTTACARWGWPVIAVPFAGRGDLVAMDADGGPALGVCLGALSAFAGPDGIDYRPTLNARAAWRIE